MASILNEAFDPNFLKVIQGGVQETTELLKQKFDKIFFTGSTTVGKIIYKAAAEHLTPVTLELGGKSPVIITKDANIKMAAKRIVWGKFLNAGQTCIAPDYLYVDAQISESLFHLSSSDWDNIILAYEPVWAIGTGETASSDQVQEMHSFIRNFIAQKYSTDLAQKISILYGGSVKPNNAKEIFSMEDVDGGLIGGASLKSKDFFSIVNSF